MRRLLNLLVAVAALGSATVCFADLTAVFDVSISRTSAPGLNLTKGGPEKTTKSQLTVRLGKDYLLFDDGEDAVLIDLHSRLVTNRTRKDAKYRESSLDRKST